MMSTYLIIFVVLLILMLCCIAKNGKVTVVIELFPFRMTMEAKRKKHKK